ELGGLGCRHEETRRGEQKSGGPSRAYEESQAGLHKVNSNARSVPASLARMLTMPPIRQSPLRGIRPGLVAIQRSAKKPRKICLTPARISKGLQTNPTRRKTILSEQRSVKKPISCENENPKQNQNCSVVAGYKR